jgi:methyl-galactoside transport system ATP-binding protein
LFGLSEKSSGEILLDGERIENDSPTKAMKNGFAYLTEERRVDGIFGILSLTENTTISSLKSYRRLCFISGKGQTRATEDMMRALRIKAPSAKEKIRSLSGGNQQKVILARWLLTEPRVLLLDEPTRGIDVGAKYDIYLLIKKLASEGCGIIVVSSEMPELIGITHRIIVMSAGRVAGELQSAEATQENIMTLSTKYL